MGKTSLLFKISDPATLDFYLKSDSKNYVVSYLDLHPVENDYNPFLFWKEALSPLFNGAVKADIVRQILECEKAQYSRISLNKLFNMLADNKLTFVLLLDEFERLINHAEFLTPSFFTNLRSLSTTKGSLVIMVLWDLKGLTADMGSGKKMPVSIDIKP
jgi:hypothetical protein